MTSVRRDNLPLLTRLVFPSIKDVLFLAFLFVPLMTTETGVLHDGDTGWHIRNGEHILATWEFPRADYFSYTRQGAPWFAWEWLADVVMAIVYRLAGLNGILVWANLLFASTFSILFYWVLNRGGNLFLCLLFTTLGGFASAVHWLARPHLFSMLFVLVWSILLSRMQEESASANSRSKLSWILPPMILVWANLHGGFVVGLILLLIYSIANFLTSVTNSDAQQCRQAKDSCSHFLKLTGFCLLVTLLNPYGIQLHLHIFDSYLFSQYLVDRITEFASPNFHTMVVRFFELILLSGIVIFGSSFRRLSFVEIGVLVFWTHMALFSVRHVPLFTLLLVPMVVRHGSEYLEGVVREPRLAAWVGRSVSRFNAYSEQLRAFEIQFKGIVYPLTAALILIWVCLNQGNFFGANVMNAAFDSKQFPVKAAAFIEKSDLVGNLFTTDYWGGYMIYRFHPRHKVFFDGRSDMYGKEFLKEYEALTNLEHSWKTVLDNHQVAWILLPVNFGLATALKERADWQVIYDDQQAIIFRRRGILPTQDLPKS